MSGKHGQISWHLNSNNMCQAELLYSNSNSRNGILALFSFWRIVDQAPPVELHGQTGPCGSLMIPVGLAAPSRLGFSPGACASPSKGPEGAGPARMSSIRGPRLAKGFAKWSWPEFGLATSCSKQRCRLCLWGITEEGDHHRRVIMAT